MDTGVWRTDEVRAVCGVLQVPQQQPDHYDSYQRVQWSFWASDLVSAPERMHECVWMHISGESERPRVGQQSRVGVVLEPGAVVAMMRMLMHLRGS